jgi:hypothetical protein
MDSLLGNGYGYDLATARMRELQREADRVHLISVDLRERRRRAWLRAALPEPAGCEPKGRRRLIDLPGAVVHSLIS